MLYFLACLCILGGIYFLLVNLKWIRTSKVQDKNKPVEAQKVDNILIRVFSMLLILIGIYLIYPEKQSAKNEIANSVTPAVQKNPVSAAEKWNDELLGILIKQCLENGKKTAENYPDLVNEYCKCASDNISAALTPAEYTEIMSKSKEEQSATIRPIVQTCANILTKLIQLSEEAKPDFNKAKK